jgi:hypothetical protein
LWALLFSNGGILISYKVNLELKKKKGLLHPNKNGKKQVLVLGSIKYIKKFEPCTWGVKIKNTWGRKKKIFHIKYIRILEIMFTGSVVK